MTDDSSSRIVEVLRDWMVTAPPGARLPSTRALVAAHHASPVTVQKALRELTNQGLVETRPGVGRGGHHPVTQYLDNPRTAIVVHDTI